MDSAISSLFFEAVSNMSLIKNFAIQKRKEYLQALGAGDAVSNNSTVDELEKERHSLYTERQSAMCLVYDMVEARLLKTQIDHWILENASFVKDEDKFYGMYSKTLRTFVTVSYNHGKPLVAGANPKDRWYQGEDQLFASTFALQGSYAHIKKFLYLLNNYQVVPEILLTVLNFAMLYAIPQGHNQKYAIDWRTASTAAAESIWHGHGNRSRNSKPFFHNHIYSEMVRKVMHLMFQLECKANQAQHRRSWLSESMVFDKVTEWDELKFQFVFGLLQLGWDPLTGSSALNGEHHQEHDKEHDEEHNEEHDEEDHENSNDKDSENQKQSRIPLPDAYQVSFDNMQVKFTHEDSTPSTEYMESGFLKERYKFPIFAGTSSPIWNRVSQGHASVSKKGESFVVPFYHKELLSKDTIHFFLNEQTDHTFRNIASDMGAEHEMPLIFQGKTSVNAWINLYDIQEETGVYNPDAISAAAGASYFHDYNDEAKRIPYEACSVLPVRELAWMFSMEREDHQQPLSSMLSIQTFERPLDRNVAFAHIVTSNKNLPTPIKTLDVQTARIRMPFQFRPGHSTSNGLAKNNMQHPELVKAFVLLAKKGVENIADMENGRDTKKRTEIFERHRKILTEKGDKLEKLANYAAKNKVRLSEDIETKRKDLRKYAAEYAKDLKAYNALWKEGGDGKKYKLDGNNTKVKAMDIIQISPNMFFYWLKFENGAECRMTLHTWDIFEPSSHTSDSSALNVPTMTVSKDALMLQKMENMRKKCGWFEKLGTLGGDTLAQKTSSFPTSMQTQSALAQKRLAGKDVEYWLAISKLFDNEEFDDE